MKETVEEYLKRGGKINVIEYDEPTVKKALRDKFREQMRKLKNRK